MNLTQKMMNTSRDYFYETKEIEEIFKEIIRAGMDKRRRYSVAVILIAILALIVIILIFV